MDTSDRIRVIGVASTWAIWGLICLFWVVEDDPNDIFSGFFGFLFHIVFYTATIAGFVYGAIWFMNYGADYLGDLWDERNKPSGGEVP